MEILDKKEYQLNQCYRDRNKLAVAFVKMALLAGYNAGKGKDNNESWEDEWRNVVYVDLPGGNQVSWHIAPDELHLLKDIPEYDGEWNGEFTKDAPGWPNLILLNGR